jgi:hypothetical protein
MMLDPEAADMDKARWVCEQLRELRSTQAKPQGRDVRSKLHYLAGELQEIEEEEAVRFVRENALPGLLHLFDSHLNDSGINKSDFLFVLKVFAIFGYADGISRIPVVARLPQYRDDYLWSVVFWQLARRKEDTLAVIDALRDPLPDGRAAIAYIDLCNHYCRDGDLDVHPFDCPKGRRTLERWLSDPSSGGCPITATATLPFLSAEGRGTLFSLASEHLDPLVRMEAAWASARLGDASGWATLQAMCREPIHSLRAQAYLKELGREEMVPPEVHEPTFAAAAELCRWLAHPMEYEKPPTHIELYDTRELFWPPTNDYRRVWLFKYTYDDAGQKESGLGMVGSVTFTVDGDDADLSAEDAYGLQCAWELVWNHDPRAPEERTAVAGRRILGEYNNGF